ncbi:MAG: 1-deoxy-D-xylulose-5-phosphate reductoisomerase [Planctomycetota bacterium]
MSVPTRRQRLAILGVTGSIGQSTLDVVRALPDRLEVAAVTAHTDAEGLSAVRAEFSPRVAALTSDSPDALVEIAGRDDIDTVVHAVVGAAGVHAAHAAVASGKRLALANKESLVVAGSVLMPLAEKTGARIVPIDSEHSAIWQAMLAGKSADVDRVILTASGGPFRTWPADRIREATLDDALNHPTWDMGAKVTIDSATLFNKALEFIEAVVLFGLRPDQVQVVVHPQSIIHSMVEFADGNVLAQLSPPDMRTPIQYALLHPDRPAGPARRFDWTQPMNLTFEPPDEERFPALRLAREAATAGGAMPAVLNAANEEAVSAFRTGRLGFVEIAQVVGRTMLDWQTPVQDEPSLDELLNADGHARVLARNHIASGAFG